LTRPSIRTGSPTPVTGCRLSRAASRESISQKIASNRPAVDNIGANRCRVGQKNGTPWRKPKKSGGSPSGVKLPPMLATRKMNKRTMWARRRRQALARMSGRIKSMAAPVVPVRLASPVPSAKNPTLKVGLPLKLPRTRIPPVTVYSAQRRMMKGT